MDVIKIVKMAELEVFSRTLKEKIGNNCFDFLDEEQIILLSIAKRLLTKATPPFSAICIDYSFMLLPASKALEEHLRKIAKKLELIKKETDDIGRVFDGKDAHIKLRDKNEYRGVPKRILGTWNSCRNDLLHYKKRFFVKTIDDAKKKFEEVLEIMRISYEAYIDPYFHPATNPLDEIPNPVK